MDRIDSTDVGFMRLALDEARSALQRGDRPIGAVIVHEGRVVGRGSNAFRSADSDVAHAELDAIQATASFLRAHGPSCTIYTTCEPCPMCIGAIVMANVRNVVYGMPDYHTGGRLGLRANPYMSERIDRYVGGVLEDECVALFRRFSAKEADLCLFGRAGGGPSA